MPELRLGDRKVGASNPTYFIADIGANHDGDLGRAKELVLLAAAAGADAAKFQNFDAETIVSRVGFEQLGAKASHQAGWQKSVFDVYRDASLDLGWTAGLVEECKRAGIEYFTSPYSLELVDAVEPFVSLFKIGSGEITWLELLEHVARKGKPVLLATGAATFEEVRRAVAVILRHTQELVLMQCNTNYTGSPENFRHVNLGVLNTYAKAYPQLVLGLSDHTAGHATALGAVALGARVIEKHFTDDNTREGPDHAFAMTPSTWREMVDRTREIEEALGDGIKRIEENEGETVVLQRRALRASRPLEAGSTLARADLVPLRPCPPEAIDPSSLDVVVGRRLRLALGEGDVLTWLHLD